MDRKSNAKQNAKQDAKRNTKQNTKQDAELNSIKPEFTAAADDIMGALCDIVVSLYIILILLVLPLYFQDGFNHIGSDKSYFFRQVSFKLGIVAYALLAIHILIMLFAGIMHRTVKKTLLSAKVSVTDAFVLIYGIGVIVSYFCSEYREEALLGTDKWYMGTLPQIAFVSGYFFISRYWKIHKWILASVLPVTFVVFVLGVLNRFGIYPIDMKLESSAFISTVGNINWYCGYAVTIYFAALGVLWLNGITGMKGKILALLYAAAGFATMVTQGSDSGIVAMTAVLAVMFVLSSDKETQCSFGLIMCVFAVVCAAIGIAGKYTPFKSVYEKYAALYPSIRLLTGSGFTAAMAAVALVYVLWVKLYICGEKGNFQDKMKNAARIRKIAACLFALAVLSVIIFTCINTLLQGKLTAALGEAADEYFYFNSDWGSGRGASFKIASICFVEQNALHKLIGIGADCMSAYLYSGRSERALGLATESFGTLRLTNAHNEWLTILVNQGIIGLAGFAGIICSAVYRFLGRYKNNIFAAACGLGILAYSVNNIVSFQTSINTPTMFVLLGIGECFIRREK